MNVIDTHIQAFTEEILMKFGIQLDFFSVIFEQEMPVTDIVIPSYEIYGVGHFVIQVLETKYFVQGITYFRPFIRGFLVFLIGLYNVRMFLAFIRQDLGIAVGKGSDVHNELNKEKGSKS